MAFSPGWRLGLGFGLKWDLAKNNKYEEITAVTISIGEINTGKARFHAQFLFDLHGFDQNILSSRIVYSKPQQKI